MIAASRYPTLSSLNQISISAIPCSWHPSFPVSFHSMSRPLPFLPYHLHLLFWAQEGIREIFLLLPLSQVFLPHSSQGWGKELYGELRPLSVPVPELLGNTSGARGREQGPASCCCPCWAQLQVAQLEQGSSSSRAPPAPGSARNSGRQGRWEQEVGALFMEGKERHESRGWKGIFTSFSDLKTPGCCSYDPKGITMIQVGRGVQPCHFTCSGLAPCIHIFDSALEQSDALDDFLRPLLL